MKTLISIYGSLIMLMILHTNNKLHAQTPSILDLALNVDKMSKQQQLKDAQIFAAYDQKPYVPNKVEPTLSFELAKKKLYSYIFGTAMQRGKQPAYYNVNTKQAFRRCKNVVVTDEYLQFTKPNPETAKDSVTIYYKDILNYPIIYYSPFRNDIYVYTKVKEHEFGSAIFELPDVFYYIQQYYSLHYYHTELTAFKQTADEYLLLSEKPEFSEEQRKYFIQGNKLAESGDNYKAIELYEKGISINPISYPQAYYNLALIASMADCYPYAVYCMKKYLMLVPNASDAGDCQDKIYGWEALYPILK